MRYLGMDVHAKSTVWCLMDEQGQVLRASTLAKKTRLCSREVDQWWLRELHERFGVTASELARRFDKSPSWVSRRLALVRELPEAVQELVRSGALVRTRR